MSQGMSRIEPDRPATIADRATSSSQTCDAREVSDDSTLPAMPSQRAHMTWQTTFMIAAAIFLGLGLLGSMWKLARPLAILVLGLSLASALASPAGWLSHWIPRMFSVILVHALLIIVLVGVGILIAPPLASQAQDVSAGLPQALDWLNVQAEHIGLQGLQSIAENATSSLTGLGSQLLKLPMTLWNTFLDIIVVFALSFYALLAAPAANRFFLSLLPRNRRDDMEHVLNRIVKGMGGYLRGIFIMGVIVGVVTYIGLLILGVPYPIVLSVLAGLLEFVPVLGTTVSVIVITAVAASQSITLGLITFVFVEIVQLVEGNILFPTIVGRETHSSPLLNMFAFFAGISVGGILGGIVAVPLAVALRAVFVEAVAPALRRKMGTNPT